MMPAVVRRQLNRIVGASLRRLVRPTSTTEPVVLLLRPDHLGDVLFLTPSLRWWQEHGNGYRLALAVGPWGRPAVEQHPAVDVLLELPFPGFTRHRHRRVAAYTRLWQAAYHVRQLAPAAAVVLRDDHWWGAWLAQLAGVPVRVGADHPLTRPFLTHPVPLRGRHWVERNLELVSATARLLGMTAEQPARVSPATAPLEWYSPAGAAEAAWAVVQRLGIAGPFVVVHPGAGAPVKQWPALRWAALARHLSQAGYPVVVTGSAAERSLAETVAQLAGPGVVACAGETTLASLAELFRQAALVVGPDTGPLHLAVAVGTPTVHLFGPSDPTAFGPWGDPHRHRVLTAGWRCMLCENLGHDREVAGCLAALPVHRVVDVCLAMLGHDTRNAH